MNFETRSIAPDSPVVAQPDWIDEGEIRAAKRRRNLIIAVMVATVAALLLVAYLMSGGGDEKTAAGAAGASDKGGRAAATVTVVAPGRSLVENVISATGSLAARVDMPVGVVGEGGQVTRVLVQPGQWVGAGQILATVDRQVQVQQLASLQAQVAVAQSNARLAQANLDRASALLARGFVSRANIDTLTAQRDAAAAQVRVAQAQVGQARASTARLDIRAPAAGLVLTRNVEPGQTVGVGSGVLFRIARGGEMELRAAVGESDLRAIPVGARATVTPVGSTTGFAGQVWQNAVTIDPQSRQGIARIALPYNRALLPGGFAEARIVAGAVQAPMLPESAVQNDDQGTYVYVIGANNRAERRAVTTGMVNADGVAILSGLNGNERVVLSAGAFLSPNDQVTPVMDRPSPVAAATAR
jgi:HlyD family secretion protein